MNAAANTDPNAPADSPTSKRTRRKPDPEPERRTPPARRPKAGQPDPEEGRIQRRNPPDPAIDLPFSDVINKLIGASGRTRKDVAQAAGISEFTANDLVWGRRAWTLRNAIIVPKELGYRPSEALVLAGLGSAGDVVAGRHPVVDHLVGGVETVGYRVRVGARGRRPAALTEQPCGLVMPLACEHTAGACCC